MCKNRGIFITYLVYLTILQFQLNWLKYFLKTSVKTVWHCCELDIWSRSLKVVWTGKAQWVVPSCKVWPLWCLRKNPPVFNNPSHLTKLKHVNYPSWIHTRVTQIVLCMIILMYVATIQHLNYRGQESKTHNLQFISDTPVTLKQGQGYQTETENVDLKKGYNLAKFKDLAFMVLEKRPTF